MSVTVHEHIDSISIGWSSVCFKWSNGLSSRILRELSSELSHPLCCLFNKSLQSGIVPASYKEANVCPIHKKGIALMSAITDLYLY